MLNEHRLRFVKWVVSTTVLIHKYIFHTATLFFSLLTVPFTHHKILFPRSFVCPFIAYFHFHALTRTWLEKERIGLILFLYYHSSWLGTTFWKKSYQMRLTAKANCLFLKSGPVPTPFFDGKGPSYIQWYDTIKCVSFFLCVPVLFPC